MSTTSSQQPNSNSQNDIAIKVEGVYKSFKLPHEKSGSIKGALLGWRKRKRGYENQHVLDNISFEIKKGEFFGIVGRNGSGKSTLLKLISQIYSPDKGSITVNGKLTPFIELGVGFNPELSGRDNVYLNGALLGFNREEMEAMYDEIVAFAELERFMDQKLKNYSSGMQVRLAFSIAIRAESDVLVLDEVLAVGDAAFQQKCFDYFSKVKSGNKTIVLVSHSMASVERFCERALLLEKGEIKKIGQSSDITFQYESLFIEDSNQTSSVGKKKDDKSGSGAGFTVDMSVIQDEDLVNTVQAGKRFKIRIAITADDVVGNINVGLNLRNAQDQILFSTDSRKKVPLISFTRGETKVVVFEIDNYYTNGEYYIDAVLVNESDVSDKVVFKEKGMCKFSVMGVRDHIHSLFHPDYSVKIGD